MPYQKIVNETYNLLLQNCSEWEPRYAYYLKNIKPSTIPVYLPETLKKYTCISLEEDSKPIVELRYKGQPVATLEIDKNNERYLRISTDNAKSNEKYLVGCIDELKKADKFPWISSKGKTIRKFFKQDYGKIGHDEHTLESAFLTELSKTSSSNKSALYIQPVTFDGKRLQMATTLKASKIYNFFSPRNQKSIQQLIGYSGPKGGGIDVLARRKKGNKSYLTVIELKDKYVSTEKPEKSIGQAIAYATFVAMLIKSNKANGEEWYKKFGFKKDIPNKLTVYAVVAMPNIPKNIQIDTQNTFNTYQTLTIPNINAEIVLHYLNLDNNGKIISTSKGF